MKKIKLVGKPVDYSFSYASDYLYNLERTLVIQDKEFAKLYYPLKKYVDSKCDCYYEGDISDYVICACVYEDEK